MDIDILQLIEGAKQAQGLTVIIDVFRAFSTACYVVRNGAVEIIPVGDIDQAYQLKEENPDYILMGERAGVIRPGFDYGNSPTQIEHVDFAGKKIVQTTSAGTQGIVNATGADEIISGSFVNAAAIARYIRQQNPDVVSLVAMGWAGVESSEEDVLLAHYVRDLLTGNPTDLDDITEKLKKAKSAQKFFDPTMDWAPERDFELCTKYNCFDFVLRVEDVNGLQRFVRLDL